MKWDESAGLVPFKFQFEKILYSEIVPVRAVRDVLIGRWIAKKFRALGIAFGRRRRVYLMATRLDRSASTSDGARVAKEKTSHIIPARVARILQSPLWAASINHWALLIVDDNGFEEASLLCQLTISTGGYVDYDVAEYFTLTPNILKNGRHIGFTMCSNDAIKEQGGYDPSSP